MTENKRFVDYFDKDHNYIIQDLVNEDEYQVGFVNCDEDEFLELANALAETSCDCITDCEIVMKKLKDENEQLKKENKHLRCTIESNSQDDYINYLKKQNEQLKQELFEARKDYLIETADISDKLYLEDEIEEERKEIFGDNNDQMKGMWND